MISKAKARRETNNFFPTNGNICLRWPKKMPFFSIQDLYNNLLGTEKLTNCALLMMFFYQEKERILPKK